MNKIRSGDGNPFGSTSHAFGNPTIRRKVMFNIAQSRACDPSGRFSRWTRTSGFMVGAAAIALLAFAHIDARAAENSSRMAQEQHACAVVLGLDPSDDRYDTCVRSLDRSLSGWDQQRLVAGQRSACAQKGLQPGTPAFAMCVVNTAQTP
jgi:hypothetical protein